MTLDISKYLKNLIEKEAKISHFTVKVSVGKNADLKPAVVEAIKEQNGESFLLDADYLLVCSRKDGWTEKDKKDLFKLTNRALGQDANTMSQSDFKVFKSTSETKDTEDTEDGEETSTEVNNTVDTILFMKITIK